MIKIEHTDVYGFESAIRGMRNPMNSWDKSDSTFHVCARPGTTSYAEIGENDLKLMKSLSKAGNDHAKFLRMINVTVDITAPLYWWKEHDQYKVGTTTNSCSTMHKIHEKEFTLEDFSYEHLLEPKDVNVPNDSCCNWNWEGCGIIAPIDILEETVNMLNKAREMFLKTKDKKYWWQMIQLLPSSYNQRRTVQLNYQVLKSMYFARKDHKLDEWRDFCEWMLKLPYFREICVDI